MGKYPYILNTGSLKRFLDTIPKIGTPTKINSNTLPTLGFKSKADRPIVTVLKFIDFISESGEPTQVYRDFKTKSGQTMATALTKAYSDLMQLYPDASIKDDKTLRDFFMSTTDAGEQVVMDTVATFKTLCSYADFKAIPLEGRSPEGKGKEGEAKGQNKGQASNGVNLNVNIQLNLPITDDASVYDKIFKAIRDNLVTRD